MVIEGREEGYPAVWISSTKRVMVQIEGLRIAGARGGCADGLLVWGPTLVKISGSTVSRNRRGPADGLDSTRDGVAVRGSAREEASSSAETPLWRRSGTCWRVLA